MVITMVLERESAVIAQRKCEFSGVITALLTLTDFTLHFSCCFTKLLHSDFILLLNSFTLQEKCY